VFRNMIYDLFCQNTTHIQGDQKVSVHLMVRVQKTQKYFKQFKSLTMITQLELGMTDGVSVSLVSPWPWRSPAK
jgi:hypothetical protein